MVYNEFMTIGNRMLVAFVSGFVGAQLIKFLLDITFNHKRFASFKEALASLTRSGGMPSGHVSGLVALDLLTGVKIGFNNPVFSLAVVVTAIIAYDAMNVRKSVGEQGKLWNKVRSSKKIRVVEGHTALEVLGGIIFGLIAGGICLAIAG
jgi:acid phosphatase family membrane protein YuiD